MLAMSGDFELVSFNHTIRWKIHNFSFRRMDQESTITSPKFMTRCVDVLTWSFDLYPKGKTNPDFMQFAAQLHFRGNRDVVEVHITSVHFAIDILDAKQEKKFHKNFYYFPTFTEPKTAPINFIPLECFLEETDLYDKCLIVTCLVRTCVNQKNFWDLMNREDLLSVVRCVNELRVNPKRSDLMLFSKEEHYFRVHECILRARCPMILGNLRPIISAHTQISTDVLNCLIYYLYGVSRFEVPRHLKRELLSVARRFQLLDLERDLVSYPVLQSIETEIVVERRDLELPLNKKLFEIGCDEGEHAYIPTSDRFKFISLKVFYSVQDSVLKIDIDVSLLVAGKHIFLKCLVCLFDTEDRILKGQEYCRTFFTNEVWTLAPHILTQSVYNDLKPHVLTCCLMFSEASFKEVNRSEAYNIDDDSRCIVNNHPLACTNDLLSIFKNNVRSDLTIVAGGEEFYVHRCFVEKRSKTIRKVLEEDENIVYKIKIPFMKARICKMALIYMYSGRVDVSDRETAKELEKAAIYFRLPRLANKMLAFQLEHL